MSDRVSRAHWRRGLETNWTSPYSRPTQSTLFAICPLLTADGELLLSRQEINDLTLIPLRTIDRHLATACQLGWLEKTGRGQKYAAATYQATLPVEAIVTRLADARRVRTRGALKKGQTDPSARHFVRAENDSQRASRWRTYKDLSERSERFRDVDPAWVFAPTTFRGQLRVPAPPPIEVVPKSGSRCATGTWPYARSAPYLAGLDLAFQGDVTRRRVASRESLQPKAAQE